MFPSQDFFQKSDSFLAGRKERFNKLFLLFYIIISFQLMFIAVNVPMGNYYNPIFLSKKKPGQV